MCKRRHVSSPCSLCLTKRSSHSFHMQCNIALEETDTGEGIGFKSPRRKTLRVGFHGPRRGHNGSPTLTRCVAILPVSSFSSTPFRSRSPDSSVFLDSHSRRPSFHPSVINQAMKFTLAPLMALAVLASAVAAQNSTEGGSADCVVCLQTSLQALPLCKGLNITMGDFDPAANPAYAVCLCSSLDGAWIDTCKTKCPDVESFKASYPSNMQQAGLQCNGSTPTFVPGPSDPVAPSSSLPAAGPSPTSGGNNNKSTGQLNAVPSALFTKAMGALAIAAAVASSFI